jgi:hypothetical protein
MAEREKTHQLERILSWWGDSEYGRYPILLTHSAETPVRSEDSVARTNRAPTSQFFLDAYIGSRAFHPKGPVALAAATPLSVAFGEKAGDTDRLLLAVGSSHAGLATVRLGESTLRR